MMHQQICRYVTQGFRSFFLVLWLALPFPCWASDTVIDKICEKFRNHGFHQQLGPEDNQARGACAAWSNTLWRDLQQLGVPFSQFDVKMSGMSHWVLGTEFDGEVWVIDPSISQLFKPEVSEQRWFPGCGDFFVGSAATLREFLIWAKAEKKFFIPSAQIKEIFRDVVNPASW